GRVRPDLGRWQHLGLRHRGAALAAALDRVPAVAAGVLAARQAEVEGPVERLELVGRRLLLALGARDRERLVDRLVRAGHEVAEAAPDRAESAKRIGPARRRLEGVASTAALAERFGEDLGHGTLARVLGSRRAPNQTIARASEASMRAARTPNARQGYRN